LLCALAGCAQPVVDPADAVPAPPPDVPVACPAMPDPTVDPVTDDSSWEPFSQTLGDPPNFAQLGNGSLMSVVSRAWGRGAKAGALVELYWPSYAADNLWDSYVGLRWRGTALQWAHQLTLARQWLVPGTGRAVSEFTAPGVRLTIDDVVRPGNDAHLRRLTVENTGSESLQDVDVAYYAFYTLANLPTGDQLRYDGASGALLQTDADAGVAVATLGDRAPSIAHCGVALGSNDARVAAEQDALVPCGVDPVDAGVSGVNGVLLHRLASSIAPGERREISYAIGLGADEATALGEAQHALDAGFATCADEDQARWTAALARARVPARLPDAAREPYRRALITILQHRVKNGAFIAAPTLTSPVYKLVWPRDGAKTAVYLAEAGFADEARAFFEELERLQKSDGSFAINYVPDGSTAFLDPGAGQNENDQPGMLPWGVARVLALGGADEDWARARWPAVRRAAEYLLTITSDGLIAPSRDVWELETGGIWTYSSASAVAGLDAAATIARLAGATSDADRYAARAKAMRAAMTSQLVTPAGYFGRGLVSGAIDGRVEVANLALGAGGFGVFDDTVAPLAAVGDQVAARLLTAGGAVRRYEGDTYYGGQPWPVAAAWLARHRLARGDRAGAEALFQVVTCQAYATPSLMLGEQFDEQHRAWLSAVPLVWSEAAYVGLAAALYD
jgi:hypothetical protein